MKSDKKRDHTQNKLHSTPRQQTDAMCLPDQRRCLACGPPGYISITSIHVSPFENSEGQETWILFIVFKLGQPLSSGSKPCIHHVLYIDSVKTIHLVGLLAGEWPRVHLTHMARLLAVNDSKHFSHRNM